MAARPAICMSRSGSSHTRCSNATALIFPARCPISFATATLGGEVELPTLNGNVSLKVPAGTQSGKVFRLRGKGVITVRDPRKGDLFAKVAVETPINLTAEQKNLLKKLEASLSAGGESHNPRAGGWLDTVKRFFDRIKQ